jgi:predicted transcriptional regulator
MTGDDVESLFHLFHKRYDVFQCLCDGVLDKRTIEDRIEASRPTVDRAFRELEAEGVLTSTGTTYELSNLGERCCAVFGEADERLRTLDGARDLLAHLPADAGFDERLLADATVHHVEDHAPQAPLARIVEIGRRASEVRGYSSIVTPQYVSQFHDIVVEQGTPTTLVFTEDVVEAGQHSYAPAFEEIVAAANATVHVTPTVFTYGVIVGDDTVAVPVGAELDRLLAVVENDTDAAVAWAGEFLDRALEADGARTLDA